MILNDKVVSERFTVQGFIRDVYISPKRGTKYISVYTPYGEASFELYDDVDPTPHIGHVARLFVRLQDANFKNSKYPRKYICDGIIDNWSD